MRYRLVVLTHGDHGDVLRRTLASFHEHVTPKPWDYVCVRDGGGALPPINPDGQTWRGAVLKPQQGFCGATRAAWRAAVLPGADYVFWLEHDFVFVRDVDVRVLAAILDTNPHLAQLALMRQAVNGAEKDAGGLFQFHEARGAYDIRVTAEGHTWLEHDICLTTNPSLMRREFMAEHPWPDYHDQCEGRFSGDLRQAGYRFGHWGSGEVAVEHIGRRDGFGY